MKLTPSEEYDIKTLLSSYRATAPGTLAAERAEQAVIRWVNTTLNGREIDWQRDLDEALASLG